MHRIALTAALAMALTGSAAFAQQQQAAPPAQGQQDGQTFHHHRHHPRDPHRQAAMLSKRLNLSPEQTAQVEPILANRQQKMKALRADTSLTPDARRQQFMALHQESKQQLDAVLSPDQREQMKAMRHHMHHQWQQGGAPAPTGV